MIRLLCFFILLWIEHGGAFMDIRQFLTDKPPAVPGFADPGMPPPSFMYALGQYSPPYDITADTLEPYPGCDAYHSSVCAVQHAIRLVTQAREEACPMIEAGGSLREAAFANITDGRFQADGTRGFGVWVLTEDGTVVADQLHSHLIGQPVNGYAISGLVAQGDLLGYIEWVTRHGGGFVPHFSTRVSTTGDSIATSTYFEKCLTGERIGVSFGRAALPYSRPCSDIYDSFCAMATSRSKVGLAVVDVLNMNTAKELQGHWHHINYEEYLSPNGEWSMAESQMPWMYYPLYPGSVPGTNAGPIADSYDPLMAVGGPSSQIFVGVNLTTAAVGLAALGVVIDPNIFTYASEAAYRGGAWQDMNISDAMGTYIKILFVGGVVVNGSAYSIKVGFTHQPKAAVSGVNCSACSPVFALPCAITNVQRLFASAKAEYFTPDGDWRVISSTRRYGSTWPSALAQAAEGTDQPWPRGYFVVAVDYNGTVAAHGAEEAAIGQDAVAIFGSEVAHNQSLKAADSGGAWVQFEADDGHIYLALVQKVAKRGRFYYMAVVFRKAWASWDNECTSESATPCAEANVQALVGMAAAELLACADLVELQDKLAEVTNRTGNFSEEARGDFAAHVLSAELACLDGAVCEAESWPLYWFNLLEEALSVEEEQSWVSLPASGAYQASRAFVYRATWQELDGLDELEFVVIALVLDAPAAPVCSSQSDCPANSVCTASGCECESGFLASVTEVDNACAVLKATTLECIDVSGKVCDDSGTTCFPCPGGYTCHSGVAYPCGVGEICAEGNIAEEHCPAGTMGVESLATNVSSCQLCQPGNFSNSEGATACSKCGVGTFSSSEGAVSCTRCGIGTYQAALGTTSCSECLPGFTTAYQAATSLSDCICPIGTYLPLDGKSCQPCQEGLECTEVNTTEVSIVPVTSTLHSTSAEVWPFPQAAIGYMSLPSNGLAAYRCKDSDWCPGGAPGACALNRDPWAIGCSRCLKDYYTTSEGSCSKCNPTEVVAMLLGASFAALLGLAFVARSVNRNQLTQPHSITTAVIALGLMVTAIQTLGILGTLSVRWVEPLGTILRVMQVFAGDLHVLRINCMVGTDSVGSAILRQGLAPVAALYIASVVAFRKYVIDFTVEFDVQALNAIGAVYQLFFVSIFVSVLTPFVCFKHPGNLGYSMLDDPAVLCSWEGEHLDLAMVSLSAAVVVVLPYLALAVYATARYRSAMTHSVVGYRHLRRFQFLFFRYRPGCYWYGCVTLLRGVLVCLIPVVFRDIPSMQILGLCVILLGNCALQMHTNPWRSTHGNMMDAGINILLTLLLVCVAMSTEFTETDVVIGIFGMVLLLAVFAGAAVMASLALWRHLRPRPYFARFVCHHKADAAAQARYLQLLFQHATKQLCFLDSDHLTDLEELFDIVRVRCGELIVYLTADTLKRPWCAGEITIAWQVHKNMAAIYHPSFTRPTDEQLASLGQFLAPGDFNLSEYGIAYELVEEAYKWFLNVLHRTFPLNINLAGRNRFEAVVESVLGHASSRTSSMAHNLAIKPGCIVVSSAPQEDEATAAVGIILRLIQATLLEIAPDGGLCVLADMPPYARVEAGKAVGTARAVLVVLSAHSLASDEQIGLILSAVGSDTACIPISLPSFRFPTPVFFSELPHRFTDKAEELLGRLPMFFRLICVSFTTFAGEEVLHVQADSIIPRIPTTRIGAHHFIHSGNVQKTSSSGQHASQRPSIAATNHEVNDAFYRQIQCPLSVSSGGTAEASEETNLQDKTIASPGLTLQC